jgi:hypothetical protein
MTYVIYLFCRCVLCNSAELTELRYSNAVRNVSLNIRHIEKFYKYEYNWGSEWESDLCQSCMEVSYCEFCVYPYNEKNVHVNIYFIIYLQKVHISDSLWKLFSGHNSNI